MSPLAPRPAPLVVASEAARRTPEARVLPLVELVSRASIEPPVWNEFVAALSAELDDAAVALMLEPLSDGGARGAYLAHLGPECTGKLAELFLAGELPWRLGAAARERFLDLDETAPSIDVATTRYYREFMEPQGLAAGAPLGHVFARTEGGAPLAGLGIYQRAGHRRLTRDDLVFLDLLVPHLRQAYRVHAAMIGTQNRRDAYGEVLDRFPTGVVLLDANRNVVVSNRAARRIADLADGFSLANGRARATDGASDAVLQGAVRELLLLGRERLFSHDEGFTLRRPSGKRDFAVMVSSMLASPDVGSSLENIVAAIYISDPEFRQVGMRGLLGSFHQLTEAEIELAAMLCEGETLEAVARARGISVHTARSHLKRIFQKTDTRRQAELVGLVSAGLTNLRRSSGPDDADDS